MILIAIDGPAASGKGTLAKLIAASWGLPCLDTGLLYRAVARDVGARGYRLTDAWAALAAARSLDPATLDDPGLRSAGAGEAASIVASMPQVRAWRRFIERQAQLEPATFDAVLADIERRDARDAGRESAPMRPAPDADLLETSDLDIEAAFEAAVGLIKRKIGR